MSILKTIIYLPVEPKPPEPRSVSVLISSTSLIKNLSSPGIQICKYLFLYLSLTSSDLKLYKGGIPSRYGGRISSILDIRMKDGNKKNAVISGGIGTIFSRLTLESPIVKDKSSFILALRRSYADILARPFLKNSNFFDDGAALNFYDLTAKSNFELNEITHYIFQVT